MRAKNQFQDLANKFINQNRPRVRMGKTSGMLTLMVDGKAFAGLHGEAMAFRLEGKDRDRALSLKGSGPLGVVGGQEMDQWVQVPILQVNHWRPLAEAAMDQVARSN